jgi:hypothetical protein
MRVDNDPPTVLNEVKLDAALSALSHGSAAPSWQKAGVLLVGVRTGICV